MLCVCTSGVLADTLVFGDGDKVQGTLVRLADGKVVFNSEYAGEITVAQESVTRLEITTPAEFLLSDGSVHTTTGELNATELTLAGKGKSAISTLQAINPAPPALPKFAGRVTAGLSSSHGNTFAQSGSVSVETSYETVKGLTAADMTYVATRAEDGLGEKYTSEEYFTAGAKHEFNLSPKSYGFADARFKKDHIANLDRRLIGTLGLGYRFYKTGDFSLNGDLGLSQLHEKYTVDEASDTNDNLSLRLGYNMSWNINPRLSFKHNLEYYPSTEEVSDYYLSAKAEFRYKFNDRVYGSLKTIFDYDAIPAQGNSTTTDTKYILGLGIDF